MKHWVQEKKQTSNQSRGNRTPNVPAIMVWILSEWQLSQIGSLDGLKPSFSKKKSKQEGAQSLDTCLTDICQELGGSQSTAEPERPLEEERGSTVCVIWGSAPDRQHNGGAASYKRDPESLGGSLQLCAEDALLTVMVEFVSHLRDVKVHTVPNAGTKRGQGLLIFQGPRKHDISSWVDLTSPLKRMLMESRNYKTTMNLQCESSFVDVRFG